MNSKWRSLEKDFRDIPDQFGGLRADWSDQPTLRNEWRLAGIGSRAVEGRFEAIAAMAGKHLLSSSAAQACVRQEVLDEPNPVVRWLSAAREVTGQFETGPYGILKNEAGDHVGHLFTGSIHRVIETSALLCLKLAAEEGTDGADSDGALQVFVDEIDEFAPVLQISSKDVLPFLTKGRIDLSENEIQLCLEAALGVPLHKNDWGGEENDLYTSNLRIGGRRVTTAFALKGRGETAASLQLAHSGKNGDQLVRLTQSPADLFVVQYVGMISENIVKDMEGKVLALRAKGRSATFCIIDGQDTARLMRAFQQD